MGIEDFYSLFSEKNIFEIKEYMLEKGWNSKEDFIIQNNKKKFTITFYNDLLSFSDTIENETQKKEQIIKVASKCLYYDLKQDIVI